MRNQMNPLEKNTKFLVMQSAQFWKAGERSLLSLSEVERKS